MNKQQNQDKNDLKPFENISSIPQMNQISFYYPPYYPMLPFYPFNQTTFSQKPEKILQEVAVQTQKSYFQNSQSSSSLVFNQRVEQAEIKEFPLPNKQKIFELFQLQSSKKKQILHLVSQLCSDKTKALNSYYRSIGEKIVNFKKTKEEIIKFLVRRAWKKQNEGTSQARDKYYSQYKSMNAEYLQVIFNEQPFVEAYEDMLKNFNSEFDAFNLQRFNRFYEYLLHCYINNNLILFKTSKQCKSKLPYPLFWKLQIYEIAQNLYSTYHLKRPQKRQNSQSQINFSKKISNDIESENKS